MTHSSSGYRLSIIAEKTGHRSEGQLAMLCLQSAKRAMTASVQLSFSLCLVWNPVPCLGATTLRVDLPWLS